MSDSPRVWLIGEQNPYGDRHGHKQRFALYPLPAHASGGRLARILELTVDEYLDAFERRNLVSGPEWSAKLARVEAERLRREAADGDAFVLCGEKVATAFGYTFEPLAEHTERRSDLTLAQPAAYFTLLVIPHPSGLSRAWNDRTMAPRVRAAVARLRERVAGKVPA